jgi:hypothetical protein
MIEHSIRIADIDDAALLSQLGARTFREAFGHLLLIDALDSYTAATYTPESQMDELSRPSRRFLIVEVEGHAAGTPCCIHARHSQ